MTGALLCAPYLAGVSVAIFSIFSCTHLQSGVSYLDADFNIVCYDALHWRYIAAAVVWLFIVPIGVPVFFIALLRHFKVPRMAALLQDNAWLREIVKLGWQEGLAQPGGMDAGKVSVDDIGDTHLEALSAYFLHGASVDEAAEIMSGARLGVIEAPPPEEPEPAGLLAPLHRAKRAALARFAQFMARRRALPDDTPAEVARRALLLNALLAWCRTSGRVATPPVVQWEDGPEEKEDEQAPRETCEPAIGTKLEQLLVSAPPADSRRVLSKDLPALQERALKECGFLFAVYRAGCWCAQPARRVPHSLNPPRAS